MMAAFPGGDGVCTPRSRRAKNGSAGRLEAGATRAEPGASRRGTRGALGSPASSRSPLPADPCVRGAGGASFTLVPHPQHLLEDARCTIVHSEIEKEEEKERKQHASHQGMEQTGIQNC